MTLKPPHSPATEPEDGQRAGGQDKPLKMMVCHHCKLSQLTKHDQICIGCFNYKFIDGGFFKDQAGLDLFHDILDKLPL